MLVVYFLLFSLLHLSSSACGAADVEGATAARWNRRLLGSIPADVPSSSSSLAAAVAALRQDNHVATHAASTSSGEHVRTTTRRLQGWPPSPSPAPDVEVRDGAVEGSGSNGMPRAMMMAPSPRGDNGGHKEAAVGEQAGGQSSSSERVITGDGPERNDDIGIDYAAPKTHPPSNN